MPKSGRINIWSWHGLSWNGLRTRDKANDVRTTQWALAWIASLLVASAAIKLGQVAPPVAAALAVLTLIPAWKFVGAYRKLLREADEMLRQVQLEALAAGCGAGLIGGMTIALFARPGQWWLLGALFPMAIAYLARVMIAAHALEREGREEP
jgi:hypothetical protein